MACVIKFQRALPKCKCGRTPSLPEWREFQECFECRSEKSEFIRKSKQKEITLKKMKNGLLLD